MTPSADAVLYRYCYLLWPAQRVADELHTSRTAIGAILINREINRGPGRIATAQQFSMLRYARRARRRQSIRSIAAELGMDRAVLARILRRYDECQASWVRRALEMHRQSVPWSALSKSFRRDRRVIRGLVARRARYEYAALLSDGTWRAPRTRRIVQAYCGEGRTMRDIANEIGVDHKVINRELQRADVARVAAGCTGTQEQSMRTQQAFRLRAQGLPYRAISQQLGTHYTSVRSSLIRYAEIVMPWVEAALQRHRNGMAWGAIADEIGQDADHVRLVVSRKFHFDRNIRRTDEQN